MPRLRKQAVRTTRQSFAKNPDAATTSFLEASSNDWSPPEAIGQHLSNLSDSPMVAIRKAIPTSGPETSSEYKSFIGDFLSGEKTLELSECSPRLTTAKFQFKTALIASDPPELQRSSPLGKRQPKDASVDVDEIHLIEDETTQLPESASKTTSDEIDYDFSKSPFHTQTNPIPSHSPRAPKVSRSSPTAAATIHLMDSDEQPPQVDDMKEFRFDESHEADDASVLKKSFTQDIVTGFLNTQSDFFETQMGKTVDDECFFPPKEPLKKYSTVGTMTDPVEEQLEIRQPLAEKVLQHRESIRAIVSNLNRTNTTIVRLMGQLEKVCRNSNAH